MRVWVTGSQGLVGRLVVEKAQEKGFDVTGSSHALCDICDKESVKSCVDEVQPDVIINCAAYTQVDLAEQERDLAFAVNAQGPEILADVARQRGARLIHLSTDYVFGGEERDVPYRETDFCSPINVYGKTKWEGEKRVLDAYPDACVVRTSWIFGRGGKSFVSSLLERFLEQKQLRVVSDQRSKPTYVSDLAEALLTLLPVSGIVHFAGGSGGSRYEIANQLLALAKEGGHPVVCEEILEAKSSDFSTLAKRPSYSELDTTLYTELTGVKPRSFFETTTEFLNAL